jgi:hypothetical protein
MLWEVGIEEKRCGGSKKGISRRVKVLIDSY